MFANKARVLLILPQDVLDRARVVAGKATTRFKLPVSLQIVLRALVEEGLRRDDDAALLANIEGQAKAIRNLRALARRGEPAGYERGDRGSGRRQRASAPARPTSRH